MKKTLTFDQTKRLLAVIAAKRTDMALVTALLLCGGKARSWTWEDALSSIVDLPFAVYGVLKELAISKRLTLIPFNHQYFKPVHWVGASLKEAVFTCGSSTSLHPSTSPRPSTSGNEHPPLRVNSKALTTQAVTDRLKRYARRAGLEPALVSLRTLVNTHYLLIDLYGDADALAEALGIFIPAPTPLPSASRQIGKRDLGGRNPRRDARLHGINRRSALMKTA